MASFWMRNTLIPLDMLFIKADGTILNIHQRAIPHDETGINSEAPLRAGLDLNGGTASRLGIRPGDRVRRAIYADSPAAQPCYGPRPAALPGRAIGEKHP